jgi:hypothetical protein
MPRRTRDPVQSPRTQLHTPAPPDPTVRAPTRRILARVPAARDASAGELLLERYRLLERLGAGGFGVVWRAHDELLQREVALKRIALGLGGDSERAMREALAAARLCHPAIVALYEACARDGDVYLISELVEGDTLGRLLADGLLNDEQVLEIGIALAGALTHAHARGVVHRDIKPQNVLVPKPSHQPCQAAKLTDFGGASLAGEDVLTRTGDILGTLAYMAPEQSEGRPVAEEADLYSLALVLYEALCGVNPVRGPTPAATARRIGRHVEPLRRRRGDLAPALSDALDRALLPSPRARGTLEELRVALEDAKADSAESPTRPGRIAVRRARAEAEPSGRHATPPRAPGASAVRALRPREPPPRWVPRDDAIDGRIADPHAAAPAARGAAEGPSARPAPRGAIPRRAWLAGMLALCCWQTISGRPGLALLLLAALAPAIAFAGEGGSQRLPGGRLSCALAPLLGAVGLAGVFPALAGQARSAGERLLRGALGYWWLTLAAPLLATRLWLPLPTGTPARASWEGSVELTVTHVIAPALTLGVLLGALLWGCAAAVLPWIVRGREPWLDALGALLWSLALLLAQPMLDWGLNATAAHGQPRGAILAALLGAAVAVAARALRGPVGRECA